MIDYKLVLILVLSIVLLFVYNKTEELREEVDKLKKKKKEDESRDKVKTSEELLNLFQEKNRIITEDSEKKKKFLDIKCDINSNNNENPSCNFPVISQNQSLSKSYIVEKDNTSSYNATESSEEIDINYEEASTSQNDEYVVFSNDKENSEIINMQHAIDNLESNPTIILDNSDILLTTTLLSKTYEGNIDIINDSSNSEEKNNINIQELETYSEASKEDSEEENIMKEFDKIEIVNENGVIQLQKVSDQDSDSDSDDIINNDFSEENSASVDGDINTSEFQKINLTSISKYKLNDLQRLAKKFNIEITKAKNGKEINKTKKELYNELSFHKEN